MSFFDEADEPLAEPRTEPRRRRPSGTGGRRPPGDHQAIMVRRIVAAVAIVIVLILIVVGVHSCQVSQRNSAMKDYANQFSALNLESTQNGANVFKTLSSGGGASAAPTMSTKLNELRVTADSQLQKAQSLSVPDEMKGAQQQFLLTMTQRRDGIQGIAQNIEQALGTTTSKDAINAIAANMARFYSSDVIYKEYASHQVVNALNNAGLTVGGANGVQIDSSQFLPDIAWLSPTAIARTLGASVPSSGGGHVAPGLHGHSLDSVSVGGTTLSTA